MPRRAVARACSNIALCKYWGKLTVAPRADETELEYRLRSLNCPATSSISLALAALSTETSVEELPQRLEEDEFELDGKPASPDALERVTEYLSLWRQAGLLSGHFRVVSRNNFPTAAGLASSASAYAALATALNALADEPVDRVDLSRWARRGSGSAARSVPGGLSAMEAKVDAPAHLVLSASEVPWAMAVCIVEAPPKEIPSRRGMESSRDSSAFYPAWLEQAEDDYEVVIETLWNARNYDPPAGETLMAIGQLAQDNCLAMHAVMQTTREQPLLYWAPGTVAVMQECLRGRLPAFFTIDAGPHVCLLCLQENVDLVAGAAAQIPGVHHVIPSLPGGPAEIISLE